MGTSNFIIDKCFDVWRATPFPKGSQISVPCRKSTESRRRPQNRSKKICVDGAPHLKNPLNFRLSSHSEYVSQVCLQPCMLCCSREFLKHQVLFTASCRKQRHLGSRIKFQRGRSKHCMTFCITPFPHRYSGRETLYMAKYMCSPENDVHPRTPLTSYQEGRN